MTSYRISKYNPILRIDGNYLQDEWTSYSDIGKVFSNKVITSEDYETIEKHYIECIIELLSVCQIEKLQVVYIEKYDDVIWNNNQELSLQQVQLIIKDCLRDKCWAMLQADSCYLHFGYDYYVYIGLAMSEEEVEKIAQKHQLFAEKYLSPYIL